MQQKRATGRSWDTPQRRAFGTSIREARKTSYESQEAFAAALRVAPAYVSQMESGRRVPSDELLRDMGRLLPNAADWDALRVEAHRLRSPSDLAALLEKPQSTPEIFRDRLFQRLQRELEGTELPKESRDKLIANWLAQMELIRNHRQDRLQSKPKPHTSLAKRSG